MMVSPTATCLSGYPTASTSMRNQIAPREDYPENWMVLSRVGKKQSAGRER